MHRDGRFVATQRFAGQRLYEDELCIPDDDHVNNSEMTAGGRTLKVEERTSEHASVGSEVSAVSSNDDADGVITPPVPAVKLKFRKSSAG